MHGSSFAPAPSTSGLARCTAPVPRSLTPLAGSRRGRGGGAGSRRRRPTSSIKVQKFYANIKQVTAHVPQTVTNAHVRHDKTSDGTVWIEKPGKMRWDYVEKKDGNDRGQEELHLERHDALRRRARQQAGHQEEPPAGPDAGRGDVPLRQGRSQDRVQRRSSTRPAVRREGRHRAQADAEAAVGAVQEPYLVVDPTDFHVKESVIVDSSNNVNHFQFYRARLREADQGQLVRVRRAQRAELPHHRRRSAAAAAQQAAALPHRARSSRLRECSPLRRRERPALRVSRAGQRAARACCCTASPTPRTRGIARCPRSRAPAFARSRRSCAAITRPRSRRTAPYDTRHARPRRARADRGARRASRDRRRSRLGRERGVRAPRRSAPSACGCSSRSRSRTRDRSSRRRVLLWTLRHFFPLAPQARGRKIRANDFAYIDELWRRWSPAWKRHPGERDRAASRKRSRSPAASRPRAGTTRRSDAAARRPSHKHASRCRRSRSRASTT